MRDGARLVRRGRARGGDLLRYRRLAPLRPAGGANPLGAAARSQPAVRPTSPALHRPRTRAAADPPLGHTALAAGGYIPRGPRPPGRRDPAAVVLLVHLPHPEIGRRPSTERGEVSVVAGLFKK